MGGKWGKGLRKRDLRTRQYLFLFRICLPTSRPEINSIVCKPSSIGSQLFLSKVWNLNLQKWFPYINKTVISYMYTGVDPDSFVMGSECRRHEISRVVRGHPPRKILNFKLSEMPFPGFWGQLWEYYDFAKDHTKNWQNNTFQVFKACMARTADPHFKRRTVVVSN